MRARVWSLPVAYFLLTAAMTVVIFTSPGADTNHFLDLLAASVLVLGERLTREAERARLALAVPLVLAVLSAATWLPGMISIKSLIEKGGKHERRADSSLAARLGTVSHDPT